MKISGCLLKYNIVDKNGITFAKDCNKNAPDKIPVLTEYNSKIFDVVAGNGKLSYTEDGIYCECDVKDDTFEKNPLLENFGFFANKVKYDGHTVIEMTIRCIVLQPESVMDGTEITKLADIIHEEYIMTAEEIKERLRL